MGRYCRKCFRRNDKKRGDGHVGVIFYRRGGGAGGGSNLLHTKYTAFSDPYFPAFGLNIEVCCVNLRIQSKSGENADQKKLRIRLFFTQCQSQYIIATLSL